MSVLPDNKDPKFIIGQRFLSHYKHTQLYQKYALATLQELQMLDRKYEGMSLEAAYKYTFDKMPTYVKEFYGEEEEWQVI